MLGKPKSDEYNHFYQPYIDQIEEGDLLEALQVQSHALATFFRKHLDKADFRYDDDKWSVKEVLNHINDTERIFAYRALSIVRGEKQELPGFDQNAYQENSHSNLRTLESLVEEFEAIRLSTILFFEHVAESDGKIQGNASGSPVSVRALAAMIIGHANHHIQVIQQKYL